MSNFNKISFLVNGNQNIGLGHAYRCISIALEAITRGSEIFFLVQEDSFVQKLLEDHNLEYKAFDKSTWDASKANKSEFIELLQDSDALIIDLLENEFISFSFLSKLPIKIASITSFYYAEKNRYEDISFFPGIKQKRKKAIVLKEKHIPLFSGSKYLTFRDEFKKDFKKTFNEEVPLILVTMGGSDAFKFTPLVLKSLLQLDINYKALIVINKKAKTYKEVANLVKGKSHIKLASNVTNMADLMYRSTIALINGGLTRYELALTGTPFIAISIHEKQFKITQKITNLVGGVNLGIAKNLSQTTITLSVKDLIDDVGKRKKISNRLQKIIDYKGTSRILDCIESLETKRR